MPALRLAAVASSPNHELTAVRLLAWNIRQGGGSWLTARLTRAELASDLRWSEIASVSLLGGVGFTVALLIGDLTFEGHPDLREIAKTGVLIGSVIAAVLAVISLRRRTAERSRTQT